MATVNPIPDGLHTVTPSLSVEGAAEAIEFYKRAFGAEERMRAPDPTGKKIWHAELRIGNSAFFINDTAPEMGATPSFSSLWIYTADADAAFERAVKAGATVTMPMADMFWGDRVGMLVDRWNIKWTIAKRVKNLTDAETKVAQDAFIAQMAKQKK
jgi:PhnB protein